MVVSMHVLAIYVMEIVCDVAVEVATAIHGYLTQQLIMPQNCRAIIKLWQLRLF